jgi:hypothetical protein
MKVVYRHRRLDTGDIFYIGIGDKKRAYNKKARSIYWKNIVNKCGYTVEIIAEDLAKEDAIELEIFLIQLYGRKDLRLGTLVNLTDGGDGNLNPSEEWREKASLRVKGENNYFFNNPLFGESNGNFGNYWTEEQKSSLAEKKKGTKPSEDTKKIWREQRKGGLNPKAKLVLDTQTGIFYETATEASKIIGMPPNKFIKHLNGQIKNKTNYIYV